MRSILVVTAALFLLVGHAAAEDTDVSAVPPLKAQMQNDVTFLTGGIGNREEDEIRALESDYNVRVALTRADGAYLSDITIVIEDADGKALVETTTRGPILLAELEPGRYVLRASTQGRTTERRVIDVPNEPDRVRLYVALEDISQQAKQ